ncbi:hypothetical protein J5N97_004492 [Dioscorea zingiberensis]|uniref:Uncharacterized protein n=1 Tax=Dioscorea zingiberensis TaxID=325984 RepID=A0A9D5D6B6_9LILI|nr:hypothetical protein J5N97_004492 [Dioscorea zingiberensis]
MSTDQTSTPPKITFFTLPTKRPETPGMATPPLRPPGGVPFIWEEAPGKPKVKREPRLPPGPVTKSLDPPPRKVAAPTNVLDGPSSESSIQSSSFGEGRSRSFRDQRDQGDHFKDEEKQEFSKHFLACKLSLLGLYQWGDEALAMEEEP